MAAETDSKERRIKMFNKLEITGTIKVETGMHIGASDGFAAIGAIDSPVIKDALTRKPYIPGSSLKGKMRSLLAKAYNENLTVRRRDDDDEKITRLFGSSADRKSGKPKPSRLIFSDTIISNYKELKDLGVSEVEAKEENSIDPLTAEANPRQIERVIRGAEFPLNIIYNLDSEDEFLEDMKSVALAFELLRHDYIGGHGSRGYGRVSINDLQVDCIVGEMDESKIEECRKILEGK